MRWQVTRGGVAAKVADEAIKRGLPVPDSCLPPDLEPHLHEYVDHFWTLSTDRALGFGAIGPIPWRAIDSYAHRNGFGDDEVAYDDFVVFVTAMDEEYLLVQREQAEAKTSGGTSK